MEAETLFVLRPVGAHISLQGFAQLIVFGPSVRSTLGHHELFVHSVELNLANNQWVDLMVLPEHFTECSIKDVALSKAAGK